MSNPSSRWRVPKRTRSSPVRAARRSSGPSSICGVALRRSDEMPRPASCAPAARHTSPCARSAIAAALSLRGEAGYEALLDRLEADARACLGSGATIERDPAGAGGVIARDRQRLDRRHLADARRARPRGARNRGRGVVGVTGRVLRVNGSVVEVDGHARSRHARDRRRRRARSAGRGHRRGGRPRDHPGLRIHGWTDPRRARRAAAGFRSRPSSGRVCSGASSTGCCGRWPPPRIS